MVSLLEIDAADAIAGVNDAVCRLTDQIAASNSRPKLLDLPASVTVDSSGNGVMVFDRCPSGRLWSVRSLAVGLRLSSSAGTGQVQLIASNSPNNYGWPAAAPAIPSGDVLDNGNTWPTEGPMIAFYPGPADLAPIMPGQYLVVAILGGTTSTEYVGSAVIEDRPYE